MIKDTFFRQKETLNLGGRLMDLTTPKIMGILNITPDSFYSQSRVQFADEILEKAALMLKDGAIFLDIGAYSSRPGALDISVEEELARLIPVVELIRDNFKEAIISVDTFRAEVAEKAVNAGAHIINDISGGSLDPMMFRTVGRLKVPYILMHMRGTPQNMASLNHYEDMMAEIIHYFSVKIQALKTFGVNDVILDPGFGFAKGISQNFELLKHLPDLQMLGLPILAGLSRKSMIWKKLNIEPENALNGTSALNMLALKNEAKILRVHDVKEAKECISLFDAYENAN